MATDEQRLQKLKARIAELEQAVADIGGTGDDPTIEFAPLVVDGTEYKLAYSFNSIAVAERVAGCNLLRGLESLLDLSAGQLRGLLYAALLIAHPLVTVEQAGKLIRIDTLADITNALGDAYSKSMPEKKSEPAAAGAGNA